MKLTIYECRGNGCQNVPADGEQEQMERHVICWKPQSSKDIRQGLSDKFRKRAECGPKIMCVRPLGKKKKTPLLQKSMSRLSANWSTHMPGTGATKVHKSESDLQSSWSFHYSEDTKDLMTQ